jgi:hypothetical protein
MNLIIKTNPADWDDSLIVAQGVTKDGFVLSSTVTQLRAGDLPEPWLSTWHAVVEDLKGVGDGSVVCVMATAALIADDEGTVAARLDTCWQWPDGRTMPPLTILRTSPDAIALLNYLLTPVAYNP